MIIVFFFIIFIRVFKEIKRGVKSITYQLNDWHQLSPVKPSLIQSLGEPLWQAKLVNRGRQWF